MGVKIQWIDPNIDPLDTVEIWRSPTKAGAPVKIGSVAGNVREYQDDTADRNKVSWYTLVSVLGQGQAISNPFPVGNFPDTGPGPKTIMRGDWEFGVFGEVDANQLPGFSEIQEKVGIAPNNSVTRFYKWIVNGRIIFIPWGPYSSAFGSTVSGAPIMVPVGKSNEAGVVIDREGYGYNIRPPYATNNFTSELTTVADGGDETLKLSEMAAIMTSLVGMDTKLMYGDMKWGDISPAAVGSNYYLTNTYINASNTPLVASISASPILAKSTNTSTIRGLWPVYELLLT
ncbi:hypothetical protein AVA65_07550 [Salmonella enterica subsp. enterica serovar Minnesota]|nr:hypothetical protein [Salmonella enterica subsp. enterica serovar Minnesota]